MRKSRYADNPMEKFGSEGEGRAITGEETEAKVESYF